MPKLKPARRGIPMTEAWIRPTPARTPVGSWHPSVIYYMRFDSLVKIGITRRIAHRLRQVPNEGLLAVEFGSIHEERERHYQFGHLRRLGEWFTLGPELGTHIADLRESFATTHGLTVEAWLESQS